MTTATLTPPALADVEEEAPRSKKKLLLVVLVLALAAGAAWWFLGRSSADAAPQPGAVVKLDAIQVNLADSHYLRIGIALQASKDAGTEVDGSKALDATIELFSGRSMEDLSQKKYRDRLKSQLAGRLDKAYDGDVIGVYFTDFVTQ